MAAFTTGGFFLPALKTYLCTVRATVQYLQEKFDLFNNLYFGGKLERIPLETGNAASYLGICTFKSRRIPFRGVEQYGFKIRISTRLDLPEQEVEDTLIHEMIHYYIWSNRIKDSSTHGKEFRRWMDHINSTYGRHITVTHHSTKEQREAAIDTRPKWHVVAIVSFKDGREGLKQLPRIRQRIAAYDRALRRSGKISGIEYYLVQDAWFNRFPTSSAFNVFFVPMDEARAHLSGATRLVE